MWNTTVGISVVLLAVIKCTRLLAPFIMVWLYTAMFLVVSSGIPPFRLNGLRWETRLTALTPSLERLMAVVILLALLKLLVESLDSMVERWWWNLLSPDVLTAIFIVLVRLL